MAVGAYQTSNFAYQGAGVFAYQESTPAVLQIANDGGRLPRLDLEEYLTTGRLLKPDAPKQARDAVVAIAESELISVSHETIEDRLRAVLQETDTPYQAEYALAVNELIALAANIAPAPIDFDDDIIAAVVLFLTE